jgi:hypothetical protein
MQVALAVVLVAVAGWFATRGWARRTPSPARVLALVTVVVSVAPSLIWLVAGQINVRRQVAHWNELLQANPGKSLAQLAPGFSMAGAFEGAAALVFSLLLVASGSVAMHPPDAKNAPASRLRLGIDAAVLVVLCGASVAASGLALWAVRGGVE